MKPPLLLCLSSIAGIGVAIAVATPRTALADDPAPPTPSKDAGGPATTGKLVVGDAGKRPPGWTPGLALGGTLSVLDARDVVGQPSGTTLAVSFAVDADLEFNEGVHEWRSSLKAGLGATRTPAIDEFVKSTDSLAVETTYLAHLHELVGPFGRLGLRTTMLPSLDVRAAAVDYDVKNADGTVTRYTGKRLALTDAFQPITFKQTVGAFAQPIRSDDVNVEARLGVGGEETLANGQLALQDDAATPATEVVTLSNAYLVGVEAIANAWGALDDDKRISYTVGLDVLVPFAHNDLARGDDRDGFDLTGVELRAGLTVRLFDWASLDYKLGVLRQPLIVDSTQVTNTLLLTFGASWGSKAPAPPPPCDCAKEPEKPADANANADASIDASTKKEGTP